MSARAFQFAVALVLFFATLTPLGNCFDTWDKNPAPANDTEIHLTAWFVGAGIVLVLTKALQQAPALVRIVPSKRRPQARLSRRLSFVAHPLPEPTGSPPPLALRI